MGEGRSKDGQASLPSPQSTKSYWHKEPSKLLLGHQTTASLPEVADIVIIGSGITGAVAARTLKEGYAKDKTVLMLEAREACWGATGRNGGHCQPIVYGPYPTVAAFELRCFHFLQDLVTAHDIPCDWTPVEGVHAFFSPHLFAAARAQLHLAQKRDPSLLAAAHAVGRDSASPSLADLGVSRADGAVRQQNAAGLWPYKLVAWILEDLLKRFGGEGGERAKAGFNLQTNTPALHLQRLTSSETCSESWIVHTDRGQVAAKHVLLASNAYTSHLLPAFSDLLVPVRGQVLALTPGPGRALRHTYVFVDDPPVGPHMEDYLIERAGSGGEWIFGGERAASATPTVGVSDDGGVDAETSRRLRAVLPRVLDPARTGQGDDEAEVSFEWTGIMGFSRDNVPWVGGVPESLGGGEGLWLCGGYTGHGMPQAALCAKAVAELIGGAAAEEVDLPSSFLLTKERVGQARVLEEVAMQTGILGLATPREEQ